MTRNRRLKGAVGVALAACMVATVVPAGGVFTMLDNMTGIKMAYAGQQTKPLTTTVITSEIGAHTEKGMYTYDPLNKTVTVTGAGTKFDKDGGVDNLFFAGFSARGNFTITAKISATTEEAGGQAGIILRNSSDSDETGSASAAIYEDFSKKQVRYGYHNENTGGGASQLNSAITTSSSEIYMKMEVVGTKVTFYLSSTPDFTTETTKSKSQTLASLNAKTVGFFATKGVKATFSDVTVTSSYQNADHKDVNKLIFDSKQGEVVPTDATSAAYSGKYDTDFTYKKVPSGNVLSILQARPTSAEKANVKGNIRSDQNFNYWLFPKTDQDMTISADITVKSLNSGTDKQGIVLGQFSAVDGTAMEFDALHIQKNKVVQHSFTNSPGNGGCGNPKCNINIGDTYSLTYTKKDNTAIVTVQAADGTVLLDHESYPLDTYSTSIQQGKSVSYGMGFCGAEADISNLTLKNAADQIVYDMNDYYVAVGVAPVIEGAKAEVSTDRNSINLNWEVTTQGSGNIKYAVYVSKDGEPYTKAGDTKVTSFNFKGMTGDGNYAFKVVPYGGETVGTELITGSVTYQKPLAQPQMTASADAKKVTLTWSSVEGADRYQVYRKLGSEGTYEAVTETGTCNYTDTDVQSEEPYYYYVIAESADNTSNPSDALQVLPSDGHTGAYVYEEAAAKLNVITKSNDTVAEGKAEIKMESDRDGTLQVYVNDELKDTRLVESGKEFSLSPSLIQGRNDVEILFKDANGLVTRKTFNFISQPVYNLVVDAAYQGKDGEVIDGYPTYRSIQAAVKAVPADNKESKVIFIKNGEYEERVEVTSPYVSLLGEDSIKTRLYDSVCVAKGNADSMWNRNVMYVDSAANGFTAENMTIENSYDYTNGNDQQADALCIVADQTECVNVRLVGYQDTLLTDTRVKGDDGNYEVTRQYFDKCYITGNVDFIYGAGTSVFHDCDIVARYTPYKSDGCYSAGRTYGTTRYGFVFDHCHFLAEDGVADGTYRMARPWGADDSTTFLDCYLGRAINIKNTEEGGYSYGDMSGNLAANARFAEHASYGPGYVVDPTRPLLTSVEAAEYATDKVMGDYNYSAILAKMYRSADKPDADKSDTDKPDTDKPDGEKSDTGKTETGKTDPQESQTVNDQAGTSDSAVDSGAGNGSEVNNSQSAQTGDPRAVGLFTGLLAVSGAGAMTAARKRRKHTKEED